MSPLPVEGILPQLRSTLKDHPIGVLTAPPGAGKTTLVPLALHQDPSLGHLKIVMLEPRRIAARAAAHRMAEILGEPVGETVGYRTRLDTKIGHKTRVEVVTEGILTRLLQQDPSLQDYGLIIFDEFHERSLQGDVGLALALHSQTLFRKDLRLLIMSATLDISTLAQRFPTAPFLSCQGAPFPIETRYLEALSPKDFTQRVANIIHRLLLKEHGNILVFLPGAGEIRAIQERLTTLSLSPQTLIAPLYGHLSPRAQDQAILPPTEGLRKVVLATNIAETSLTIEGIRIVLDTGLMRVPRFDPRSGMSRLVTVNVSQASAEQRRGRAGRLEPGLCVRCWPEPRTRTLPLRSLPEILEADLTSLALELAMWGTYDPGELLWLDPPPAGAFSQANQLLRELDALDKEGRITAHGQQIMTLSTHPRLAHMILRGHTMQLGPLACDLAALLEEPRIFREIKQEDQADLRIQMDAYYRKASQKSASGMIQRIRQTSQRWQQALGLTREKAKPEAAIDAIGILLALAYPERVAHQQYDGSRRYKLANGRLARFHRPHPLEHDPYLVIAHLDGNQPISRIFLASPIREEDLRAKFIDRVQTHERVEWDEATQSIMAKRERRFGAIILEEAPLAKSNPELVLAALLKGIRSQGLSCLPWTKELRSFQARALFLKRMIASTEEWPDLTDATLLATLETWLAPYLSGIGSLRQIKRIDLTRPLQAFFSPEQRRSIDTLAPTHLRVPTGSHIALDYQSGEIPILAVRIQELFGLTETPTLVNGQVSVLIHLLSPARRPVQVTRDLKSFWTTSYPEVKKELKGRYPKHHWPDDPLQAPPTRGIKKR